MPGPATCESLRARHDAIISQYIENDHLVKDIQQQALQELIPLLQQEFDATASPLPNSDEIIAAAKTFLQDQVTVFRFSRRARFNPSAALKLLHATLTFRFSPGSTFLSLSPASIDPLYLNDPLFFFHPDLHDRFGRPCAVLNLRYVARTQDGQLSGMKDFIRLGWEVSRRWLSDRSRRLSEPHLQIVVIVDLEGAGMSNLEVELLPFFMDLLKSHFPGMVGAIFVLNYGWMYAGMWQLAKRVLPNTALERILFPTKAQLLEFFEEDHLLIEHGGTISYTYTPSNPILAKYGLPLQSASSAYPSPSPSPSHSSSSLHSEVFHSATSSRTPSFSGSIPVAGSGRRPSGLEMTPTTTTTTPAAITESTSGSMSTVSGNINSTATPTPMTIKRPNPTASSPSFTPSAALAAIAARSPIGLGFMLNGWRGTPRPDRDQANATGSGLGTGAAGGGAGDRDPPGSTLKRVTSLAELQERLAETQKAIESDDSDLEDELDDEQRRYGGGGGGVVRGGRGFEMMTEGQVGPEELMSVAGTDQEEEDGELFGDSDTYDGTMSGGDQSRAMSSAGTSARSSRYSSRATSRNVSRDASREASPARSFRSGLGSMTPAHGGGVEASPLTPGLSSASASRAVKYSGLRHLSPYNHSNPYYGYPAFVPSSSQDPTMIPRPHHHRRRKRDLARTLTYLAALRFLALHRNVRNRVFALVRFLLRLAGLASYAPPVPGTPRTPGGGPLLYRPNGLLLDLVPDDHDADGLTSAKDKDTKGKRRVHWESDSRRADVKLAALAASPSLSSSSSFSSSPFTATTLGHARSQYQSSLEQFLTLLALFAIVRTPELGPKLVRSIRLVLLTVPAGVIRAVVELLKNGASFSWVVVRGGAVSSASGGPTRRVRRRDVLRRAVGQGGRKLVEWAEKGEV